MIGYYIKAINPEKKKVKELSQLKYWAIILEAVDTMMAMWLNVNFQKRGKGILVSDWLGRSTTCQVNMEDRFWHTITYISTVRLIMHNFDPKTSPKQVWLFQLSSFYRQKPRFKFRT